MLSVEAVYFRGQQAKRTCLHVRLARVFPILSSTAARRKYPATCRATSQISYQLAGKSHLLQTRQELLFSCKGKATGREICSWRLPAVKEHDLSRNPMKTPVLSEHEPQAKCELSTAAFEWSGSAFRMGSCSLTASASATTFSLSGSCGLNKLQWTM